MRLLNALGGLLLGAILLLRAAHPAPPAFALNLEVEVPLPVAPDSVKADPLSPDPLAPDSLAPDPLAPDSLAPDPATPDSVVSDPVLSDPVVSDPVWPDSLALDPVTFSPTSSPDSLRVAPATPKELSLIVPPPAAGGIEPLDWRQDSYWMLLWGGKWSEGLTLPRRLLLSEDRAQIQEQTSYDPHLNRILVTRRQKDFNIVPPRTFTPSEFSRTYTRMTFDRLWAPETKRTLKGGAIETNPNARPTGGLVNLDIPVELPGVMKGIFGDGPPNLRVSGSERISVGGTSSWRVNDLATEGRRRSRFPTLEMRQELNVRLNGTIGDKLHIDIAQNSEASTSLENQIKIYYQGYDDDVVQRVDLGNTNLSLPKTQYISLNARQEGLFGIKMSGRLADWDFTAIASKQEGQSDAATFNGGSRESRIGGEDGQIFDYEYDKRRYFFLDDPDTLVATSLRGRSVNATELAVFVDRGNITGDNRGGEAVFPAFLSLDGITPLLDQNGNKRYGNFIKMKENDEYYYSNRESVAFPYLALRSSLSDNYTLAVSYVSRNADDTVAQRIGDFFSPTAGDTLMFKVIRPPKGYLDSDNLLDGPFAPTRRLELRNVYNLQVRDIDPESFNIQVHRLGGNNPTSLGDVDYLQVLGLDLENNQNNLSLERDPSRGGPDGKVDDRFVDYTNGLLFLPGLRPFDPSCVDLNGANICEGTLPGSTNLGFRAPARDAPRRRGLGWRRVVDPSIPRGAPLFGFRYVPVGSDSALVEKNPRIYDRREILDQYKVYYLSGTFKATQTEINLQKQGILENSETVRMDGEILNRGVDYQITYETGQVRLLSDRARNPNGNLQITYSYTPLFARGNKSLVGLSTNSSTNEHWEFSTTLLYESKSVPERRPRLQQEPTRTILADMSGAIKGRPWMLTRITDALPLVRTNVPSSYSIGGALGLSVPNPNTKGDVYLDDMEGVVQTTSASVARESWQYSSRPASEKLRPRPDALLRDEDRMGGLWFSVQRQVQARDLSPRLETIEGNDYISVLGVILLPPAPGAVQPWFSLVQPLSEDGVDLSKAQYIDVWVNDFNRYHGVNAPEGLGKELRINLGSVNEDAVWDPRTPPARANGRLDYEDRNKNGERTPLEDVGLDAADSLASPNRVGEIPGSRPEVPGAPELTGFPVVTAEDPSGDDYVFTGQSEDYSGNIDELARRFRKLNGTEANQRLDSEDMNGRFDLNADDNYFEYTLPLSSEEFTVIDVRKDYGVADPDNGWRLLRIPLNHPSRHQVGDPKFETIRQVRLWFNGFADTTYLQIASIEIVGNRYERQKLRRADGSIIPDAEQFAQGKQFEVAVVNNKQNSEYTPPFAVERIDRVTEREQSLSLEFSNLDGGEQASAFRSLQRDEDYTLYQSTSYFLQSRPGSSGDSLEFFLRFGSISSSDTSNAYEVATLLTEPNSWRRLDLELERISGMKQGLLDSLTTVRGIADPKAYADSLLNIPTRLNFSLDLGNGTTLRMYGKPSFSQVRRIQAGVRNAGSRRVNRGSVWFNELRLGQVRRDIGVAARGNASLNLGDVASLTASYTSRDADFLQLGQSRGSGSSSRDFNFGAAVNLEKFLPGFNLLLPLRFDRRSSLNTPKFRTGDDQIFSGERGGIDITDSKSSSYNLSIRRTSDPGTPWYLRQTIDALSVSGNYNRSSNRSTTQVDSTLSATGSVAYNLGLGGAPTLRLKGGLIVAPFPTQLSLNYSTGYNETSRNARTTREPDGGDRITRSTSRTSGLAFQTGFRPINPVSWNLTSQRNLVDSDFSLNGQYRPKLNFMGLDLGREVNRQERLQVNQGINILGFLRPRVTWTGEYSEDHGARNVTANDVEGFEDTLSLPSGARYPVPDLKNIGNRSSTQVSMTLPLASFLRKLTTPRAKAAKDAPGGSGGAGAVVNPPFGTIPDRFQKPPEEGEVDPQERGEVDPRDSQTPPPPPPPLPVAQPGPVVPAVTAPGDTGRVSRPSRPPEAAGAGGTTVASPPAAEPPRPPTPAEIEKEKERLRKEAKQAEEERRRAEEQIRKDEERRRKDEEKIRKEEEKRRKREERGSTRGIGSRRAPKPVKPEQKDDPSSDAVSDSSRSVVTPPAITADSLAVGAGSDSTGGRPAGTAIEEQIERDRLKRQKEAEERAAREAQKKQENERKRQESEAARLAEKAKPKGPAPSLTQLLFRDLLSLGDIRTSYNLSNSNSVSRVFGAPSPLFRLGLTEDFGDVDPGVNSTLTRTATNSAQASGTATILRDFSVDANFQTNIQKSTNQGSATKSSSTTWPSLRMNLSALEKKLHLRRWVQSFTASSNYERREEKSGTKTNPNERSTVTTSWRPFFQCDTGLKNGWRLNLSTDRSTTLSRSNPSGQEGRETRTEKNSHAYRMAVAKSLNLKRGGGRTTTVDLSVDLNYSKDASVTSSISTNSPDIRTASDRFAGRLSTTYRFTSTVSGSMQLSVGQNRDLEADQTDRTIGLQASASISF